MNWARSVFFWKCDWNKRLKLILLSNFKVFWKCSKFFMQCLFLIVLRRCFLNENRLPCFWKRVFQISFLAKHLWNKVFVGLNHHWSDFHQFFYYFPPIFVIWKENHTLKAEIDRFLLLPIDNVRLDAIALLRVIFVLAKWLQVCRRMRLK